MEHDALAAHARDLGGAVASVGGMRRSPASGFPGPDPSGVVDVVAASVRDVMPPVQPAASPTHAQSA